MARVSTATYRELERRRLGGVTVEPTRRRGFESKWERSFRVEWLEPWMRDGLRAVHEGIRLRIYAGSGVERACWYTPDFVVLGCGSPRALEVKGFRRRDAIVRLKACAALYPEIKFGLALNGPGRWDVRWL